MKFNPNRNWLRCEKSLNQLQPNIAQPVRNQFATSSAIKFHKTETWLLVDEWLLLVGCLKIALVGWGVCLRHPHRNHSTNRMKKEPEQ